jgi:truncated hemoglobin YjbI/quinol monooxygenase YgiN
MVTEYIRYRLPQEREDGFVAAYERAAEALRAAPECADFELSRCIEEPVCYILRITWTSVEDHLKGFRGGPVFGDFLAAVRPYLSDIEEMRHYERTTVHGAGGAAPPSLYTWAGGTEAFISLCDAFYRLVLKDELLAPMFATMDAEHVRNVALWLAEVFGGPPAYSERRGGYPAMVERHTGRSITEPQRRRWFNLMMDAADEVGLPQDPEFRAAFASYIEWGTRLALHNSQPGADVVRGAPMPKWGWGVAPPYLG